VVARTFATALNTDLQFAGASLTRCKGAAARVLRDREAIIDHKTGTRAREGLRSDPRAMNRRVKFDAQRIHAIVAASSKPWGMRMDDDKPVMDTITDAVSSAASATADAATTAVTAVKKTAKKAKKAVKKAVKVSPKKKKAKKAAKKAAKKSAKKATKAKKTTKKAGKKAGKKKKAKKSKR
jgi:hypothetical protein